MRGIVSWQCAIVLHGLQEGALQREVEVLCVKQRASCNPASPCPLGFCSKSGMILGTGEMHGVI